MYLQSSDRKFVFAMMGFDVIFHEPPSVMGRMDSDFQSEV